MACDNWWYNINNYFGEVTMTKNRYIWTFGSILILIVVLSINSSFNKPQTMLEYIKTKITENNNQLNLQSIGGLPDNPGVYPVLVISVSTNRINYTTGQNIIIHAIYRVYNTHDINPFSNDKYVFQGGLLSQNGDYIDGSGNLMAIAVQENYCENNLNSHYANREIEIDFDGEEYKDIEVDFFVQPKKSGTFVFFANAQNYCYYHVPNGEEYEGYGYNIGNYYISYGDSNIEHNCDVIGLNMDCILYDGNVGVSTCQSDYTWSACVLKDTGSGCSLS